MLFYGGDQFSGQFRPVTECGGSDRLTTGAQTLLLQRPKSEKPAVGIYLPYFREIAAS
jgi:hypothetical protein